MSETRYGPEGCPAGFQPQAGQGQAGRQQRGQLDPAARDTATTASEADGRGHGRRAADLAADTTAAAVAAALGSTADGEPAAVISTDVERPAGGSSCRTKVSTGHWSEKNISGEADSDQRVPS